MCMVGTQGCDSPRNKLHDNLPFNLAPRFPFMGSSALSPHG